MREFIVLEAHVVKWVGDLVNPDLKAYIFFVNSSSTFEICKYENFVLR